VLESSVVLRNENFLKIFYKAFEKY
jgi:hypothetical protein